MGIATEHPLIVLLRDAGLVVSDLILKQTGDKDFIYVTKELFLNIGKEFNF